MTIPTFPTRFFSPGEQRVSLAGQAISGGVSTAGFVTSALSSGGGYWVFEFAAINLNKAPKLKLWRAMEGLLDGGATQIIVPICDCRQAPEGAGFIGGIPHSDGTLFDDESGYSQGGLSATAGAAALRATQITITFDGDATLQGGEHFSITHATKGRRMYRVVGYDAATGVTKFRPTLREAITADTEIDFNDPSCTMRLVNADQFAPNVTGARFANASATFVEVF